MRVQSTQGGSNNEFELQSEIDLEAFGGGDGGEEGVSAEIAMLPDFIMDGQ